MPTTTIPLVGTFTARGNSKSVGTSAKDQQYINALFEVAQNEQGGSKSVWVMKRPGSATFSTVASGQKSVISQSFYFNLLFATTTNLYLSDTIGTVKTLGSFTLGLSGNSVTEGVMSNQDVIAFIGGSFAYYCFKDAVTTNFPTFTGDTHTNTVIDNIASTTGLYPGQLITGTGIQAATRIATITSATAITTTLATTATNAGVTITKEAIARVIDADVPSSPITVLINGGYLFIGFQDGRIFNADINQPWSVSATSYVNCDFSADLLGWLLKVGDTIVAIGTSSRQYFTITGNTSGSVLSVNREANIYDDNVYQSFVYNSGVGYALAVNANNAYGLFRFSGPNEFTNISDQITGGVLRAGVDTLGVVDFDKRKLVIVFNASTSFCIVYDPSNGMFSEFILSSALTGSWNGYFTKNDGAATPYSWAGGNTWQDSGVAYTMTIQSEPIVLNNGNPCEIKKWTLVNADTQSSGSTTLTFSIDDYASFITVGAFDLTVPNKEVWGGGFVNSAFAFKLADSGNNAWRAQAIAIEWEPCER